MNAAFDAVVDWCATPHGMLILSIVGWRIIVLPGIQLFRNAYEHAIERGEQKEREGRWTRTKP